MGIKLIGTLEQANNGKFPLIDSNAIKGGLYSVDSIEELNSIPTERQKEGMIAWVDGDEKKYYKLEKGSWIVLEFGSSSNINSIDNLNSTSTTSPLSANQGKILNDKITAIDDNLLDITRDDTSGEGISSTTYDTLKTTDKTLIGGINEINENRAVKTSVEDGKLYLLKNDGSKIDTGTTLPTSASEEDIDLSNYVTKDEIPTKISQLTNDSGYLIEHQDISGKVDIVDGKGLSTNDLTDELKIGYDNTKIEVEDARGSYNNLKERLYNVDTQYNTINDNLLDITRDDTSGEGVSSTTYDTLKTTDKTLIGGINEINDKMNNINQYGTTVNRPIHTIIGQIYFDTDLNKPIWRNKDNNGWVDSTGKEV